MSITIATNSKKITVKLNDLESDQTFKHLVLKLLEMDSERNCTEEVNESQEEQYIPPDFCNEAKWGNAEQAGATEQSLQIPCGKTHKGFMYIRCEHCGAIKGFCSKDELIFYKCRHCGGKTDLYSLVRLHLNCECGERFTYWTNVMEEAFDIDCIKCGAPVAVKYNSKKEIYETISK